MLTSPLGNAISNLGFGVIGRELINGFMQLRISSQVKVIQNDLMKSFWHKDARLIAHSYGGYLLLQTLAQMKPFPGKVLLLSPVLGTSRNKVNTVVSRPPWVNRLIKYASERTFPPLDIAVHTGEKDNGCDPELANTIISSIDGGKIYIIKDEGHSLNREYTGVVLREFLDIDKQLEN